MKRTGLLLWASMLLALGLGNVAAGRCAADSDAFSKMSLKGLAGVGVFVGPPSPEMVQAGLTEDRLTTDVQLRLREAGIKVLDFNQVRATPGAPVLDLSLIVRPEDHRFSFAMELELRQAVRLDRSPTTWVPAVATWSAGGMGRGDADGMQSALRGLVDRFCNDFLEQNPRK